MDNHERRHITRKRQDQENIKGSKKNNVIIPTKRQGLSVGGALGELNSNVAAAEFEREVSTNRGIVRSNYNHVQSKMDTGLATKPSSRPQREEDTGGRAVRATARAVIKYAQNKLKKSIKVQAKKATQDTKKITKFPSLKETRERSTLSPILEESAESLEKLKLADNVKNGTHEKQNDDIFSPPKLQENIIDIDASDNNLPLAMLIYNKDIYKYLTEFEEKYHIGFDHLREQTEITGEIRAILIDWLVRVQKKFSLLLETFHLTVGIIDRYLQIVPNVQKNQIRLVGITAMFIASKYEEINAPRVDSFINLTKNVSRSEVFQCEREILSKIGCCIPWPTPVRFLSRFVEAAHGTAKNRNLAKYFVDLSLVEYSMAHYRPSELAAAAICLSLHLLSEKKLSDVWTPTLSYYSGYTLKHIEPIIRKIAKIVINIRNSECKSVYYIYYNIDVGKLSGWPELKGKKIKKLANISYHNNKIRF